MPRPKKSNGQGVRLIQQAELQMTQAAWAGLFTKADRILTNTDVVFVWKTLSDGNPAGSDGRDVFVSPSSFPGVATGHPSPAELLELRGLNYHELSHILYSPRNTSRVVQWAINNNETHALNMLEDQRIETLFTTRYFQAGTYFTFPVLRWIMEDDEGDPDTAHLLTYGRKYLPVEVRAKARANMRVAYGDALVAEAEAIIDEYLNVVYGKTLDSDIIRIVEHFSALLVKLGIDPWGTNPGQGQSMTQISKGRLGQRVQSEAVSAAKQQHADDKDKLDKAEAQVAQKGEQDGAQKDEADKAQSDGEGGKEGDQEGSGNGSDSGAGPADDGDGSEGEGDGDDGDGSGDSTGDSDGDADSPETGNPAKGAGSESGDKITTPDYAGLALEDLADELAQAIVKSELVEQDYKQATQAVQAQVAGPHGHGGLRRSSRQKAPIPQGLTQLTRKVYDKLRLIQMELESDLVRGTAIGRPNIQRLLRRQPHQIEVFDQWTEDAEDEGGIEVAILVDQSSSMAGSVMAQTSHALWVLKAAFEKLRIPTTVIGFDTNQFLLYDKTERARVDELDMFPATGGTNPTDALITSYRVLSRSDKPNRLLLVLTDGQWGGYGDDAYGAIFDALRGTGVHSYIVGLNGAVEAYGTHGADAGRDIRTPADLVDVSADLVAALMGRLLVNR